MQDLIFFYAVENLSKSVGTDNIKQVMTNVEESHNEILAFFAGKNADVKIHKAVSIYTSGGECNLAVPMTVITGKDAFAAEECRGGEVIFNKEKYSSFNPRLSLAERDFADIVEQTIETCDRHQTNFSSQVIVFEKDAAVKILVKTGEDGQKLVFDFLEKHFD